MTTATLTIPRLRLLGTLLSGDGLERLTDEINDPGAVYSPGERIHLRDELRLLADLLDESAKSEAAEELRGMVGASAVKTDAGVVFEYKAPGKRTNVDEPEVRHQYPPAEYPSLYKTAVDTTALRKAFPPGDHPGLYKTTPTVERVDVKV